MFLISDHYCRNRKDNISNSGCHPGPLHFYKGKLTSLMLCVTYICIVPYSRLFWRGLILTNLAIFSPFAKIKSAIFIHCTHAQWPIRQIKICQPQKIRNSSNFDPSKYTCYTVCVCVFLIMIVYIGSNSLQYDWTDWLWEGGVPPSSVQGCI